MRSTFLRSLVLTCSFILVLPPGWCCMIPLPAPAQEGEDDTQQDKQNTPKPSPCCGCCCQAKAKAADPQAPSQPEPPPAGKCPCDERHSTAPSSPKTFAGDLLGALPLDLLDLTFCWSGAGETVTPRTASVVAPLQLLHCLWLC